MLIEGKYCACIFMTDENCTIPKLILGLPRFDFINLWLLVKLRNLYKMLKKLILYEQFVTLS